MSSYQGPPIKDVCKIVFTPSLAPCPLLSAFSGTLYPALQTFAAR